MVDWDQSHPDAASALWQLRPALRAGGPAEDGQKRQEPFDLTTTPGQFSICSQTKMVFDTGELASENQGPISVRTLNVAR